jgi:hypothetical protein
METNIPENAEINDTGNVYLYVITFREIFCRCLLKAGALDQHGERQKKCGEILVGKMARELKQYKTLTDSNRGAYYNDRIKILYDLVKKNELLRTESLSKKIMAPLIEYAGYTANLTELDEYLGSCKLNALATEKLKAFVPLLVENRLMLEPEHPLEDLPGENIADEDEHATITTLAVQTEFRVVYTPKPMGIFRYPFEGTLSFNHDGDCGYIGDGISFTIKNADIKKCGPFKMDGDGEDAWIMLEYFFNGKLKCAYFAEIEGPGKFDEFYTLRQSKKIFGALKKTQPISPE